MIIGCVLFLIFILHKNVCTNTYFFLLYYFSTVSAIFQYSANIVEGQTGLEKRDTNLSKSIYIIYIYNSSRRLKIKGAIFYLMGVLCEVFYYDEV